MSTEMLARLTAKQEEARKTRATAIESRAALVQLAKDEDRDDLTETEDTEFRKLTEEIAAADKEILDRDERIAQLAAEEQRSDKADKAFKRAALVVGDLARVKDEARQYAKGNGRSYLQDLVKGTYQGDSDARARLDRHAQEVAVEPEYAEARALNRTDGTGGYFVPPAWLMDQYAALARAGRPTANLVKNLPLPAGTDSINIPLIATGTTAAVQTADNASVSSTDLTDSSVAVPVRTIAGQQDIALQLIEQSPVSFDEIVFADLIADYNTKLDVQVISGSGSSGQVKGIRNASGINTETYTSASPTVAGLYSKLAEGIQKIHTTRYMAPNVIVMHPRRWAWLLAALDTTNRPLVVPNYQGPMNAIGTFNGVSSQDTVGSLQGLPVVTDPSIPTTAGAGTEDVILIMRSEDLLLWESGIKTRVLPDVGSGTLTVRLQVYGYVAFTAERYASAVTVASGTGLIAPTF
jgi:HK97 family phage major capsid protein